MKNQLVTKVMSNAAVSKIIGGISKFYISHESVILTGGTIGFSLATTAVTYRNAVKISDILETAQEALQQCNTKKEKNDVYKLFLKELTPLILPIIIFQLGVIACSLFAKKKSDKKIAEAAGALSIAQSAIAQYQTFQKDAENSLGKEEYQKLQSDIYKNTEVDGKRFTAIASEGAPGETLFIDKYSGRPFWSTYERVKFATKELGRMFSVNGGYEQVSINDWYDLINNPDLTPTELAERFGYFGEYQSDVDACFADTHYIFPNGTRIQAAEVYLYPEPDYLS